MEGPVIEELPVMRSLSPSTVFGEPIEIDFSQTLIQDPSKVVQITPSQMSVSSPGKSRKRKKQSKKDLALIEALWKQDVDLGVPREVFEEDGLEPPVDSQTKDKDHGKNPKSETKIDEKPDENPWMQFNFTIDSETVFELASLW